MKTSVELQEPFSYAIWPVIILGIIIAGYSMYLLLRRIRKAKMHKKPIEKAEPKQPQTLDKAQIKAKYIAQLENIKNDMWSKNLFTREVYQRTSMCIRGFVYEMTGIQVQKYTLEEIRQLNMPVLEELMMEYYPHEFAEESTGNSMETIEKTKRVIEKWN